MSESQAANPGTAREILVRYSAETILHAAELVKAGKQTEIVRNSYQPQDIEYRDA